MIGSDSPLRGQGVLVTGAASGIGHGLARHFSALGCRVLMVDLDGERLEERAAGIEGAIPVLADARSEADMERAFGASPVPVSIAIANAGVSRPRTLAVDLPVDEWDRIVDHNLKSAFVTMRAAVRHQQRHRIGGRIIATASVASVVAEPGYAAYAAAKWGVVGLVKSIAMEVAAQGIRVNAICPGDVSTRFLDETAPPGAGSGPIGRPASIRELLPWYELLAGPGGEYLVGEAIVIDGGLSLTALS
ncbi:SDR family NAD(P)-dependent oxidoreductase [Microbacterium sp. No. 7]|uniref:SDR family NAD(P)-dependent oxidoreductase n=1 Tax=Microbacterium sp. No. 7 TaxID=1714373 RepID=UPI0006D058A2|nr:SDR family oxidoreductase [Microbacterium sp. No. 7]